jgi:polar amino acid transport system substrate-binding protein
MIAVMAALVLVLSVALLGCSKSSTPPASDAGDKPANTPANTGTDTSTKSELKLIKDGVLTVGSDCDYPPFISMEGEKPVGFEYELLQAIAADMGLTLEYLSPQSFATLIASVQGGGKMDVAVSSLTINDLRKESVNFCTPYFDSN